MSRSSDYFLKEAVSGREVIRQFAELQDPEHLVPLAATQLRMMYPEMDKMECLISCRDALRRLVNKVTAERGKTFSGFLEHHGLKG